MKRSYACGILLIVAVCAVLVAAPGARAEVNLIGVGVHYGRPFRHLDKEFNNDELSWVITYQRNFSRLLALQIDGEWQRPGYQQTTSLKVETDIIAPQAHILLGGALYGGLGIGIHYMDKEFADSPFYNVRLGLDFEILPTIHIDINANYRFDDWDVINRLQESVGIDSVFMGGAVRIEF